MILTFSILEIGSRYQLVGGFRGKTAPEQVAVGASPSFIGRYAPPVGLEEALEGRCRTLALAFGEGLRERGFDVRFGESERTQVLLDAGRPPQAALGAGSGEVASEGGVVDVSALADVVEGLLDLAGGVAGAGHFLSELTLAVSAAREPGKREIPGLRLGAIS
jgi:hypothetical protein